MLLFLFRDLGKMATFQMKGEPEERELFTTESKTIYCMKQGQWLALFPTRSYWNQGLQH